MSCQVQSVYDTCLPVLAPGLTMQVLGPQTVGECCGLMLSPLAICLAVPLLQGPERGRLLRVTVGVNICCLLASIVLSFWLVLHYMTSSDRDFYTTNSYTPADCLVPLVVGISAFATQLYFSRRSWLITKRSTLFACFIATSMAVAFGGSISLTALILCNRNFVTSGNREEAMLVTVSVFLWGTVIVDVSNFVVIAWRLCKIRSTSHSDAILDRSLFRILRLSFETTFVPTLFALMSALLCAALFSTNSYNTFTSFLCPLPALYLLSLVYLIRHQDRMRSDEDAPLTLQRPPAKRVVVRSAGQKVDDDPATWFAPTLTQGRDIDTNLQKNLRTPSLNAVRSRSLVEAVQVDVAVSEYFDLRVEPDGRESPPLRELVI